MGKEFEECGMREAAIICSHITKNGLPILQAERSPRAEFADSGWQFLCNSGADEEEAEVWSVEEVIKLEPSLRDWMEAPFGTVLWRPSKKDSWRIWE